MRNIALATASVAGVFQGIRIGRNAIEQADNIGKVADALGFTVEGLQEYRFAAQQTGIEQRTFDLAAQRLTRRLGEAANGFGEARDALRFLNIDLRDSEGNIRSTEDVLGDVAEAFETIENPAERLRLAFKLFDSEGARLVNTLGRGREALDAYREQARDLGVVLSEDVVRRAEEVNDQLNILGLQVRTSLGEGVISATQNLDRLAFAGSAIAAIFGGRLVAGIVASTQALIANVSAQRASLTQSLASAAADARLARSRLSLAMLHTAEAAGRPARLAALARESQARAALAVATQTQANAQANLVRATTAAGLDCPDSGRRYWFPGRAYRRCHHGSDTGLNRMGIVG